MIELSYTWLNTLLCPYRFQQLNVRRIVEPDSDDATFGTNMHTIAALYGYSLVKARKFRDDKLYSQAMDAVVAKNNIDLDTEMQMQELAEVFLPMWSLDPTATRHAFEERIILLREGTDDRLAGTPDHVAYFPTRAVINEFKFGPGRRFEFDEAQHDRQCALYAHLVLETHPEIQEVAVNLIGPAGGPRNVSNGVFTRYTLDFIQEWIAAGWEKVDALREKYGEKDWPTYAHQDVCKWCEIECPAVAEVRARYG